MKRSIWRVRVAAMAALVVAAACERGADPLAPTAGDVAAVLTPPQGSVASTIICADGPAGTYSYQVSANTGQVALPLGTSFTLQAGECVTAAQTTGSTQSINVQQTGAPANALFEGADLYRYAVGSQFPVPQVLIGQASITSFDVEPFGHDQGRVVVFRNFTVPQGKVAEVLLCKIGAAGTHTFSLTNVKEGVTLPLGSNPSLQAGGCQVIAKTALTKRSVNITELTPPAGIAFETAFLYTARAVGKGMTQAMAGTSTLATVLASPFGPDVGHVIVYRDVTVPAVIFF